MSLPDAETNHRVGVATSNHFLPTEAVQSVPNQLADSLQNTGVNADGVSRFGPTAKFVADSINSDHVSRIGWIVFKLLA